MPHLILEYSSNVKEQTSMTSFFNECHECLAAVLPTKISSCQSRAVRRDVYCVGDGSNNNAFIHLFIKIMPGRDHVILNNALDDLAIIMRSHFEQSLAELNVQMSVEIVDLGNYKKISPSD